MTDPSRTDRLRTLLDALERYYKHVAPRDDDERRVFHETASWFQSRDRTAARSFERVCARLSLDPNRIRASLERGYADIRGALLDVMPRRSRDRARSAAPARTEPDSPC